VSLEVIGGSKTVAIETTEIAKGLHMLVGSGGNVAVLSGADGVLVIDDQYSYQYEEIANAISEISSNSAKFLVNTHWHSDHAGSNEQMANSGTVIVAHENTRARLSTDQVIEFFNADRPAAPPKALPVITFTDDITFHFNDEVIHVIHVSNAHTDGDAIVQFKHANVIHTGDTFFHGHYPFIDAGSGGSVTGMIAAANQILALCDDDTNIIPGHGALADKQSLVEYRDMMKAVRLSISDLIVAGNSDAQIVLAKPTAEFDSKWGSGFLKPNTFVKMIVDSIKRTTLK
jgi:glyoxylase-like metal-dependent hydrolase (beta-lactamase superfamily II)